VAVIGSPMTDYRKMPLGPVAPDRIGEIVECPYCHEHGLKVGDFKDPTSGSKEKEFIYIHVESGVLIRTVENGRTVEKVETVTQACPVRVKSKSPEETPVE
jgi:hypothetical protein